VDHGHKYVLPAFEISDSIIIIIIIIIIVYFPDAGYLIAYAGRG
jgi:hypothetical protein